MTSSTSEVVTNTRRLLIFQLAIGLIVAGLFGIFKGQWEFFSALYGAGSSLVIAILLGAGVKRAESKAAESPKTSMGILYFGAVQRFVAVLALFILGLALLKLEPLSLAVGFGLAQISFLFSFRLLAKPTG